MNILVTLFISNSLLSLHDNTFYKHSEIKSISSESEKPVLEEKAPIVEQKEKIKKRPRLKKPIEHEIIKDLDEPKPIESEHSNDSRLLKRNHSFVISRGGDMPIGNSVYRLPESKILLFFLILTIFMLALLSNRKKNE